MYINKTIIPQIEILTYAHNSSNIYYRGYGQRPKIFSGIIVFLWAIIEEV